MDVFCRGVVFFIAVVEVAGRVFEDVWVLAWENTRGIPSCTEGQASWISRYVDCAVATAAGAMAQDISTAEARGKW